MATTTPSNLKKEINEGILRTYLGVEDASDIDFETYRTLLKEKIAAARMGGSKMDSGDISYLTNEFLRIRKFKAPEGQKKKKIDVKKFVQKTEETRKKSERLKNKFLESRKVTPSAAPSQSVKPQMLMLPPAQQLQGGEDDQEFKEQVSKGLENIVPNLDNLQSTMESILGTLKQQALLGKKEEREEDAAEARERRVSREKVLESKGKKSGVDDKNLGKKAVKPVKGIFDMLMDFFKNILLGGALLFLLNVLKDPKRMLQPLVDALNSVLGFFNGIIRGINGFIDGFNTFIKNKRAPPNKIFLKKSINISKIPLTGLTAFFPRFLSSTPDFLPLLSNTFSLLTLLSFASAASSSLSSFLPSKDCCFKVPRILSIVL